MALTELCPYLCRYIRYTRKRGDEDAVNNNTDTKEARAYLLEISEEGKALLKNHVDMDSAEADEIKTDAAF